MHAEGSERDRDRVSAVGHPDHVLDAEILRELALERVDLRPEDKRAASDHLTDPDEDVLTQRSKWRGRVKQWNGHVRRQTLPVLPV